MTEKRFKHICNDDGSEMIQYNNGDYITDMEDATEKLNEQEKEIMDLRADNTRFKLVVKDIIKDLEKLAKSKEPIVISEEYVNWIKDNVDVEFYSKRDW